MPIKIITLLGGHALFFAPSVPHLIRIALRVLKENEALSTVSAKPKSLIKVIEYTK